MASARVGGSYWAGQPALPQAPYTLVRVRDPRARARLHATLKGGPVLSWIDALSDQRSLDAPTTIVAGACDPWHLISGAKMVITDPGDELVLAAALAGVAVTSPNGEALIDANQPEQALRRLFRDLAGRYSYADPFTDEEFTLLEAIRLCAFWRTLVDGNRPISAAIGFASWKKPTAAPLLWAGSRQVPFVTNPSRVGHGDQVAVWKSRVPATTLSRIESEGAHLIEVEDGFIRSAGLGADCVPPLSLVVDRCGIFFDPRCASELENLLQYGDYPGDLLDRARQLRALIVESGVSKYGVGHHRVERRAGGGRHLLVPGQVEDDRSVLCGGGAIRSNLDLLREVRRDAPDAYILYKPHPDVEAGHRRGAIADGGAGHFADEVVRNQPIASLIDMVDEVHVNTSLAGFEALMRDTPVTTHGVPFYAGWGLTRDLGAVPGRRTARRTLDELVAAVLLLYPRYLDPVTGLPCTPEILVRRLSEGAGGGRDGPLVAVRRLQGYVKRRLASLRA